MKQIMCVHLKQWPIDRLRRRRPELWRDAFSRGTGFQPVKPSASRLPPRVKNPCHPVPLVLVETSGSRQTVAAACETARAAGIRPGITLTQARALHSQLIHAPYEPEQDRRALEALGRWMMMRFSPLVALEPPDAILLEVGGCRRLFGGLGRLVKLVETALAKLQIAASVAVAPTVGAAWALAWIGGNADRSPVGATLVSPSTAGNCTRSTKGEADIAFLLAPLPPAALRIDDDVAGMLHHLGIDSIGQLMRLPRNALPARFGDGLLRRLDQALGRVAEPLAPLRYQAPIEASIEFDGVVESLEAIWMVFKDLIAQIVVQLIARGCGARRMEVVFKRPYADPIRKMILLSRPSRDPANLFNLLRCAMETIRSDDGFIGLRLSVPLFERLSDEQLRILEQQEQAAEAELAGLVERLQVRLGDEAVMQTQLIESHLPERAYRLVGFRFQISDLRSEISNLRSSIENRKSKIENQESPHSTPRPLHLLPEPLEVRAIASPSHEGDGPPLSFTRGGTVHRIVHAVGPERIAGMWWEGRDKTRDYFDVEDQAGRRFWMFRVIQTRRWFLHGVFQ